MSLRIKITIVAILLLCLTGFFIFALPSLIGFLLSSLLLMAGYDMYLRRQRHAYRTFNSALRAVCDRSGGVSRVATAFARSGQLRGPCYEFARRLMVGQEPVQAAADARVPLQLSTAVAMLTTPGETADEKAADSHTSTLPRSDAANVVSTYSQILYLALTGLITCGVLIYVTRKTVPGILTMFEEFAIDNDYEWLISGASPTWMLLGVMGLLLFGATLVLTQSDAMTPRFLRGIPVSTQLAEAKENILCGLADAIEAGIPFSDSLHLASKISLNGSEKTCLHEAAQLIQQGIPAANALYQTGLVDAGERDWLTDARSHRFAQLLRHFGHQEVRDAHANICWLTAVLFPLFVVLLGAAVLAYAYGFFGTLMTLLSSLAS